jgi:3',5'-cyclic AMP phosphodiesterase CpdA
MKLALRILVVALVITIIGCARPDLRIDVAEGPNPWTSLDMYNDPANFQFAVMADRTGGSLEPIFAEALVKVNQMRPEFVMCVGDLIEGYTEDVSEIRAEWNEFDSFLEKLDMPFFYVAGNHDLTNPVMYDFWTKRRGRAYYHFIYKDVLFCVLNTQDGNLTGFGGEQLQYFKDVLANNKNVRWTLVFMHQPLWREKDIPNWPRLEQALADRNYTVFAGHTHEYKKEVRNGKNYYILATTGGRYEGQPPMNFEQGRFDHIVWIAMTDSGPLLTNIPTEAIYNDNPQKKPNIP